MEPPVELEELMERIRAAVQAQRQVDGLPSRAAIPGSLSTLTPPSQIPDAARGQAALELALAEAAVLLPKAEGKTKVCPSVPKFLRPLFRNQGGFNGVVLEMLECLLEANQQLRRQNLRLQERLDILEAGSGRRHDGTA